MRAVEEARGGILAAQIGAAMIGSGIINLWLVSIEARNCDLSAWVYLAALIPFAVVILTGRRTWSRRLAVAGLCFVPLCVVIFLTTPLYGPCRFSRQGFTQIHEPLSAPGRSPVVRPNP